MSIRILIVDDNERERIVLRYVLEQIKDITIIGEAVHGLEALLLCQEKMVDLVFLDITMPEMGGIETAYKLKDLKDPPLFAFVTVQKGMAVEAYDLGALDYIVKPIEQTRIEKTIARAKNQIIHRDTIEEMVRNKLKDRLDFILEKYREDDHHFNKLPIRTKGRITLLNQRDIVYCESQNKKVNVYTGDDSFVSNYTLNELAERLDENTFFRAHQAFIVNLNFVKEIVHFGEGSYILQLESCDRDIILSRSKAKLLRQKMNL